MGAHRAIYIFSFWVQEAFFNHAGIESMVDAVLHGYNATVFAYGQVE